MKKDAEVIGVWGTRGSGKSTRCMELVNRCDRLIVFDTIGDYRGSRKVKPLHSLRVLYAHLKENWNCGFRCALVMNKDMDSEAMLEKLSHDLFIIQKPYYDRRDKREITLLVEELALCYPEKTLASDRQSFKQLVNVGRHYGVNIIGNSQRMSEVKKNFIGNCSQHYFLRMGADIDITNAARYLGRDHKAALTHMKDHHWLHLSRGIVKSGVNRRAS
jgi:hypothetical protein